MGGSNSTRRVEINDPTIAITNDVADRIEKALDSPDKPSKRRLESEDDFTDLYHNKIKELEEKNAKLLNARVDEFAQAVQEVEKKFMKSTGSPVCQDLQDKVFRCYTENHKKTLLCSPDVRAFFECVERARANALMRKG